MSWVFRGLRASIQGAALKTRQLLKKLDQNFYTCNSSCFCSAALPPETPEKNKKQHLSILLQADYGARTRHLNLGKVALYQMS